MASHAHSTRTPLLRQSTGSAGLLAPGLPTGRIIAPGGPVTRAIAVMRDADPDHPGVRSLRQKLAERIEADLELLDALDGDPDLEIENEHGGDIQDEPHDGDEREDGDDNGIADTCGRAEQFGGTLPWLFGAI